MRQRAEADEPFGLYLAFLPPSVRYQPRTESCPERGTFDPEAIKLIAYNDQGAEIARGKLSNIVSTDDPACPETIGQPAKSSLRSSKTRILDLRFCWSSQSRSAASSRLDDVPSSSSGRTRVCGTTLRSRSPNTRSSSETFGEALGMRFERFGAGRDQGIDLRHVVESAAPT